MKLILIVLTFAQIYGALSTNILRVMDTRDFSSPIAVQIAQGIDKAIGEVLNAVTDAIHNVTLWTNGKSDTRLNLLTELKTFQADLQQLILEITRSIRNGVITTEYQQLNFFLITCLNNINHMITILIPTMEDSKATDAITSCLHLAQVIEAAIEKIHILISL
jgi:hypothetical protein